MVVHGLNLREFNPERLRKRRNHLTMVAQLRLEMVRLLSETGAAQKTLSYAIKRAQRAVEDRDSFDDLYMDR